MWFILAPILATAITLFGTWLLSEDERLRKKAGWWLHVAGTILWVTYSITLDQPGMAVACAAYLIPEIKGLCKCRKEQ